MGSAAFPLYDLDPDQCRALARYYADIARALEDRAAELERRAALLAAVAARRKARIEATHTVPETVARLTARGMPLLLAFEHVARLEELPPEAVREIWRRHRRREEAASKAARDRQALQLARRGYSNAEIAERIDASPSTVGRILKIGLRA